MATNDPSLARRLLPALALTGAGLGLVNVLDHPVGTSAAGLVGQSGVGTDGASTDGAVAAGNTVPGITTVPSPTPSSGNTGSGGATTSGAGSGSGAGGGSSSGQATTQTPNTQAPAVQTPATAAPSSNVCGAIKRTGSRESIWSYGTVVVTAKFTGDGTLCSVSATYNVRSSYSAQIEEYAIPRLTQQAVAANSANINGISGATAISDAYSRSLQSAIDAK